MTHIYCDNTDVQPTQCEVCQPLVEVCDERTWYWPDDSKVIGTSMTSQEQPSQGEQEQPETVGDRFFDEICGLCKAGCADSKTSFRARIVMRSGSCAVLTRPVKLMKGELLIVSDSETCHEFDNTHDFEPRQADSSSDSKQVCGENTNFGMRAETAIATFQTVNQPKLIGQGPSLFWPQGRAKLSVRGIALEHSFEPVVEGDLASVGAVVFARNKCRVLIVRCRLQSSFGMGIWAVQSVRVVAHETLFASINRSGMALFGKSLTWAQDCIFQGCRVHGVCARGTTNVFISGCRFQSCGLRGTYVYQNSTMALSQCLVTGTKDSSRAAVEAAGCRPGDNVSLTATACRVVDNRGAGVRLRGAVLVNMLDVHSLGNDGYNLHTEPNDTKEIFPDVREKLSCVFG